MPEAYSNLKPGIVGVFRNFSFVLSYLRPVALCNALATCLEL